MLRACRGVFVALGEITPGAWRNLGTHLGTATSAIPMPNDPAPAASRRLLGVAALVATLLVALGVLLALIL